MPRTSSSAVSVKKAIQACGSVSSSIMRGLSREDSRAFVAGAMGDAGRRQMISEAEPDR
jgi:hypothetical protein